MEQESKLAKLIELVEKDPQKAHDLLSKNFKEDVEDFKNEYEGDRTIRNTQVGKRIDKKQSTVSKIGFSFQKKIVKTATNFLFGTPITINSASSKVEEIRAVWENNRMDTVMQDFSNVLKSETEAVLMFYTKESKIDGKMQKRIKIRLFDSELGNYAPYYDEYGDLIAFMWSFRAMVDEKELDHFWLFTDEVTYKYQKSQEGFKEYLPREKNLIGRIPVVFMRVEKPEWWDVKDLIDRYEWGFSSFVDMNDYFAAPTLVVTGKVSSLPEKEKSGRAVKVPRVFDGQGQERTGKLEYLTWSHAPESIKTEFQLLKEMIFSLSDTPDISFDNLKGIAPASGEAMKMQFMGAELKAKESHGKFEIALLRCFEIIEGLGAFTKEVKNDDEVVEVKFNSVVPKAVSEMIDMLSAGIGHNPVMSQRTAVKMNPLVDDVDEELREISNDKKLGEGDSYQ